MKSADHVPKEILMGVITPLGMQELEDYGSYERRYKLLICSIYYYFPLLTQMIFFRKQAKPQIPKNDLKSRTEKIDIASKTRKLWEEKFSSREDNVISDLALEQEEGNLFTEKINEIVKVSYV